MTKKIELNVNELIAILDKHYKKSITIIGVDVADVAGQYNPKYRRVGIGGICTLHLEADK